MISLVQTALALEWSIGIGLLTINENVGVTVTQGAATGTLKIALTGLENRISIEAAAEVTFSDDADLVIGSTTVEADYITDANPYCLESESYGDKKVSVNCLCGAIDQGQELCETEKQDFCTKINGQCCVCCPGTRTFIEGCEDCEKGEYNGEKEQSVCRHCPAGKYNDQEKRPDCKVCPIGWFQDKSHQDKCKQCDDGYHAKKDGAYFCMPVLPGSYDSGINVYFPLDKTNNDGDTPCPRGWFQDLSQEENCKICPQGRYQEVEGGSVCKFW